LKREIDEVCRAAFASGNYVIDVKYRSLTELRQSAISTTAFVSFEHLAAKGQGNC
jgi:hypothetical protein